MNITQMIQDGEPAVAAAVAALVDPAIQPDALRMAAVDLARQQADEIKRLRAELAALQEDLRYVAHSGMGSCAKVHAAPAGWRLVPVEPTPEMHAAFRAGFTDQLRRRRHGAPKSGFQGSAEAAGLRAMLAAAPAVCAA